MNFNNFNMINNTNPYLYLNISQFEVNRDNNIYDLSVYKDKLFITEYRHNRHIVFVLPDGNEKPFLKLTPIVKNLIDRGIIKYSYKPK